LGFFALGRGFRGRLGAGAGLPCCRFGCCSGAGGFCGWEGERGGGACLALRFRVRVRFPGGVGCLFGEGGGEVAQRHRNVAQARHQQQKQSPVRRPTMSRFRRLLQLLEEDIEMLGRGAG